MKLHNPERLLGLDEEFQKCKTPTGTCKQGNSDCLSDNHKVESLD